MVRQKRAEKAFTDEYRAAYLRRLERDRERAEQWVRLPHEHNGAHFVCMACTGNREINKADRLRADVAAGRAVVDRGYRFGVHGPDSPRDFALEADGSLTPVSRVHLDGTVYSQRPDGTLVERPTSSKARTRTKRSQTHG